MKTFRWLICLPVVAVLLAVSSSDLMARRVRRNPPPPKNNSTNATPANPAPADKKFKDLAVNTVFYFAADSNKFFPRTKISATTARSNKDGTVGTIPAETVVVTGSAKGSDSSKSAKNN